MTDGGIQPLSRAPWRDAWPFLPVTCAACTFKLTLLTCAHTFSVSPMCHGWCMRWLESRWLAIHSTLFPTLWSAATLRHTANGVLIEKYNALQRHLQSSTVWKESRLSRVAGRHTARTRHTTVCVCLQHTALPRNIRLESWWYANAFSIIWPGIISGKNECFCWETRKLRQITQN